MNTIRMIFFIIFSLSMSDLWSATHFKLSAGNKFLELEYPKNKWSDFCLGKEYGCARFESSGAFGFIKVLPNTVEFSGFKKFCTKVFSDLNGVDKEIFGYNEKNEKTYTACSWSSKNDSTIIFWKDGILLSLTFSEEKNQSSIYKMISEAKIHEKK